MGIAEKRKRSALMVLPLDISGWNCDAGGVPRSEAPFFVRVNQVLVRLWALPSQSLTGRFGVPAMAMVFRGDCCVLSESDPLARRLSLGR